jgi:hypothetical protein
MFDPLKDLVQGENSQDAGEGSLRRSRSEASPAARPAEEELRTAGRGGFAAGASADEESSERETSDVAPPGQTVSEDVAAPLPPKITRRRRGGGALRKPGEAGAAPIGPEQRVLLLDTWQRSGLPAGDFAALVGISKWTLVSWKKRGQAAAKPPLGLRYTPRRVSRFLRAISGAFRL